MKCIDACWTKAPAQGIAATSAILGIDSLHIVNEGIGLAEQILPEARAIKVLTIKFVLPASKHTVFNSVRAVSQPQVCAKIPYDIVASPTSAAANHFLPFATQSAIRTVFHRQHSNPNHHNH